MNIRPYVAADWQAVREIYDLSKPDEMRDAVAVSSIIPLEHDPPMLALFSESHVIVAEEHGAILGFAGHRGNYLSWLFVHPAHRRQGVARGLLEKILDSVEGEVELNVASTNHAARAVYARCGFSVKRQFEGEFNGQPVQVLRLACRRGAGG